MIELILNAHTNYDRSTNVIKTYRIKGEFCITM